jgi:hypothetical protein
MGMREVSAPLPECDASQASNYTARLICGANRLLRDRFPNAIVRDAARGGAVVNAAWTSVIVDPADEGYAAFLQQNARTVASELGSAAAGVCLDRGDWIPMLNAAADDGVTLTPDDGRPARALLNSWKVAIQIVAEALHAAGEGATAAPHPSASSVASTRRRLALFANPDMGHRVDMYRGVDGIFDEMADPTPGGFRTATGWLTSGGKVGIVWCHDPKSGYGNATLCGETMTNGSDTVRHHFLQSHLLLGLYPSVPVVDNDHQIQPAPRADAFYARYGPLWAELRAKRWLTTAHAVTIVDQKASSLDSSARQAGGTVRANAFERRPYGSGMYAVAVAFGAAGNVTVRLALPELRQREASPPTVTACATLLDGVHATCTVSPVAGGGLVDVIVPLTADGCAVVDVQVDRRQGSF